MGRFVDTVLLTIVLGVCCLQIATGAEKFEYCATGYWDRFENETIAGFNKEIMTDVTHVDDCLLKCKRTTDFYCISVTYSQAENSCQLSDVNRRTTGLKIVAVANVQIYQWTCPGDVRTKAEKALDYFEDRPEYVVMIGLGIVALLLVITGIVIVCSSTSAKTKSPA